MKVRPSKDLKSAKLKADKYFSLYIRQRDNDKPCVTCSGYGVKDCGHFISRRFEAVRFDEKNVQMDNAKSVTDTLRMEINLNIVYRVDKIHGKGTAESLYLKSKMLCKRNKFDYEISHKHLKTN
jgi:hypothetical protein